VTCRELTDFLMDYLGGELPPDARQEFDYHLSLCPNCRTYLHQYQETVSAGRAAFPVPGEEAPRDVPEDLLQAILAARSRVGPR
jgi:anti-sigma factor RsiW